MPQLTLGMVVKRVVSRCSVRPMLIVLRNVVCINSFLGETETSTLFFLPIVEYAYLNSRYSCFYVREVRQLSRHVTTAFTLFNVLVLTYPISSVFGGNGLVRD